MAACIAERALQRGVWLHHPMFGIAVAQDRWALAFQECRENLRQLLTPNASR
jgi:hypothetical protein